jgi:hypothetical protein
VFTWRSISSDDDDDGNNNLIFGIEDFYYDPMGFSTA